MLAALALACVACAQEPQGLRGPAKATPPATGISTATSAAHVTGGARSSSSAQSSSTARSSSSAPTTSGAPATSSVSAERSDSAKRTDSATTTTQRETLRPPATPLVVHDPFFSIWSRTDVLTDDWPRHWTGRVQAMQSMVRIDGEPFRILGPAPDDVPPLEQVERRVTPTRTSYAFENEAVRVELDFWAAVVPFDLALLARPLTYVQWNVTSRDGAPHEVSIHFDMSAEACVERPDEVVKWSREGLDGLAALRIGASDQRVLAKAGDDVRIDWGWLYVAAPAKDTTRFAVLSDKEARGAFVSGRATPFADDERNPRAANDARPVLAFEFDVGTVDAKTFATRALALAYDDVRSVRYFDERLSAYWRRDTGEMAQLLPLALAQRPKLEPMALQFDKELSAACEKLGGAAYAELVALAYRQCLGAVKLCGDANGRPLAFAKDCSGGGAIASVEASFAMSPLFLLLGTDLSKSVLVPLLDVASSSRWPHAFAPRDLGTFPHATGPARTAADVSAPHAGELEATADLLLLVAALAKAEGNAAFAARYATTLARWAATLRDAGSGSMVAHDADARVKRVLAIGAWAQIQERLGRTDDAAPWRASAATFATSWIAATSEFREKEHETWSQTPALVWDRVLELGLFPDDVLRRAVAQARSKLGSYGVPLDSRAAFTQLDASVWTACLGSREDFDALLAPVWKSLHEMQDRLPMSDAYDTQSGRTLGRYARPNVGAVLMPLLLDANAWKSWFKRGPAGSNPWAPPPIEAR